jgi:hypothetical protein
MNQIQQLIEEYAHLEHSAAIYREFSQQVPPELIRKMEGIVAWGRANIHPNSFHLAIQEVNQRVATLQAQRMEINQELDRIQGQAQRKNVLSDAVSRITKGMLGQASLTPNQLKAIVNKQPLRARIPNQHLSADQKDALMRESTKAFDPKGKGWGVKEFTRRMDELTDANEADFNRLTRYYRVDPREARLQANRWKHVRVEYGVKQRMLERHGDGGPGPILREVPDHEHRKATLATAMLADANDQSARGDSRNLDGYVGEGSIHPSYLEDTGRRGDIARSFEKVESLGFDG